MNEHSDRQDYLDEARDPAVPQWLYKDLVDIRQELSDLKAKIWPIQVAVYGFVAIAMSAVVVGLISLVVHAGGAR